MRTALFFLISAALHAAALAYPALLKTQAAPPIAVTLVESGEEGGGGGEKSPAAEKPAGAQAKRPIAAPQRTNRAPAVAEARAQREAVTLAAPAEPIFLPIVPSDASGAIEVPARAADAAIALPAAAPSGGGLSIASAANNGGGGGSGDGIASGSGDGTGSGAGRGAGNGTGDGNGNGAARFVQANYLVCPKADYPEAARREGWQGTVMVEVAVDEEGRPKSSRVYQSSGFAALDRAALDNVQRRCRFHPARRGETRVETSIKVPVEFRLADSKAR
jgi:periplasmic protein TonB